MKVKKLMVSIKDNFIYNLLHKLKSKIVIYHKIALQTKESHLNKKVDRSIKDVFIDWVVEIIQYGILFSITLLIFNINFLTLIVWIIPLGIGRWLMFDLIKTYKQLK